MPKPCADTSAGNPRHNTNADHAFRRIRKAPQANGGDGETGWPTLPLARTLVKPDASSGVRTVPLDVRSEEHTSELQSLTNLVCRLLLEKKKRRTTPHARSTMMAEYETNYNEPPKPQNYLGGPPPDDGTQPAAAPSTPAADTRRCSSTAT